MLLEEFWASCSHHHQGDALGMLGKVLNEVQHWLIGAVKVLKNDHGGIGLRDVLQESTPRREQFAALGARRCLDPNQGEQSLVEPLPFLSFRKYTLEFDAGQLLRIRIEDPRVRSDDFAERPKRNAFPEGQAAPLSPVDQIGETIKTLRGIGTMGILLVEQYLDFCLEVGDCFFIMDRGAIVAEGPISHLNDDIVKQHLTV